MLTTAPELKIKSLLLTNWNPANTSNVTPKIHTGWYNHSWGSTCQLTITDPNDSVMRGGETGITAFSGLGTLKRFVFSDMIVAPWASREMTDDNGNSFDSAGINPKSLVEEMSQEVKRIIDANRFSDSEVEYFAWLNKMRGVEHRLKPTVFRENNMVRVAYWEDAS